MTKKPKQPISVLVVIHSPDLKILLLERADKPGFWQSVTGSIEENEELGQTAAREVQEETGLDTTLYHPKNWHQSTVYEIYPHWRHRYGEGVTQNTEHVFSLCVPIESKITLSPSEHLNFRWLSIEEAANLAFSPSNQEAILQLPSQSV